MAGRPTEKGVLSNGEIKARLRQMSVELEDIAASILPKDKRPTEVEISEAREACLRVAQVQMDRLRRDMWPPDGVVTANIITRRSGDDVDIHLVVPPDVAYALGESGAKFASYLLVNYTEEGSLPNEGCDRDTGADEAPA